MNFKKSIVPVLVGVFLALTIGFSITASASEIIWHDYEKGLALGKDSNKKIMINFYGEWCRYCKKMEKETFAETRVADYLNANFIAIRIDSDKNKKLARAFDVTGLPSTWFLTEDGDKIGNRPGWVNADTFLDLLKYVHTEGYK